MIARGEDTERGVFGFKRVPAAEAEGGEGGEEKGRECRARFTTSQHLKRHLESHSKPLPHVVCLPSVPFPFLSAFEIDEV